MKKIISTVICLLLCSCSTQEDVSDTNENANKDASTSLAKNQSLSINLYNEPPTLDPRKCNDTTSFHVAKMLFEGLTRIHPNGKPAPAVAEEISVSNDLMTYRFQLRESFWSDGTPVTAHDFEYAWKSVLHPNSEAPYAYQLFVIQNGEKAKAGDASIDEVGVIAEDERTLVVTLESPTPYFLELTAFTTYFPVNKAIVESNKEWANNSSESFVSNGPFKMSDWKHHNEITLVKNENYWDAATVKLNTINMVMVSDETTELSMFENDELHWAGRPISRLPAEAIPQLRKEGKLNKQAVAGAEWYKFNTGRFPFNNVKMRRAFSYAINRQVLIEKLMPDDHAIATGIVPSPLTLQSEPYFTDGDTATARKLFDEALEEMGITKDDLPPIALSFNNFSAHRRLAQAIQQQWNRAFGIQVDLEVSEWKIHINNLRTHNYQIARLGWVADFRDPINFLEIFKFHNDAATGGNNDTQWENQEYISLLNKSAEESDPERRKQLLHQAETLFIKEMPVAPIYFMTDTYVTKPNLKGYYLSGLGDVDFKWAYFEKAQR